MASSLVENYSHEYLKENTEAKKSIVLVVSSNKGLCGGYNSQLYKRVLKFKKESQEKFEFYFIGKKVKAFLKEKGYHRRKNTSSQKMTQLLMKLRPLQANLLKNLSLAKLLMSTSAYNAFVSAIEFNSSVKQASSNDCNNR